jgi:hypothetical protein
VLTWFGRRNLSLGLVDRPSGHGLAGCAAATPPCPRPTLCSQLRTHRDNRDFISIPALAHRYVTGKARLMGLSVRLRPGNAHWALLVCLLVFSAAGALSSSRPLLPAIEGELQLPFDHGRRLLQDEWAAAVSWLGTIAIQAMNGAAAAAATRAAAAAAYGQPNPLPPWTPGTAVPNVAVLSAPPPVIAYGGWQQQQQQQQQLGGVAPPAGAERSSTYYYLPPPAAGPAPAAPAAVGSSSSGNGGGIAISIETPVSVVNPINVSTPVQVRALADRGGVDGCEVTVGWPGRILCLQVNSQCNRTAADT